MENKDVLGFSKFEKEFALFERKYNGYPYWQFIRFYVAEACLTNRVDIKVDKLSFRKVELIKRGIRSFVVAIRDLYKDLSLTQCDLLIFKHEKLKDRFFDYWIIPSNIKSYVFRTEEFSSEYNVAEHFLEYPRLRDNIYKFLSRAFKNELRDENEEKFLKDLEKELIIRFGKSPTFDFILRKIRDGISKNRFYTRYYRKILDRTNPKAILCIVYYNPKLFSLFKLAKERNIKILELQHGVINNHEEYWFEDDRGVNNYMPDYLLTFGEIHNSWIKLPSDEKTVAVGLPYQEMMKKKTRNIKTEERLVIVYPEPDERFEDVINEFANRIINEGYRVLIKLHPHQVEYYKEYYPQLSQNKNVEVIKSQEEGIYYWLKLGKHHVMASTTVGLEAMVFDHCNICISESIPHDQTQCLLDWGVARGFNSSDELVNLVRKPLENSIKLSEIKEKLWKKNSKNNLEKFFYNFSLREWK